jgi:hypothetical protein
VPNGPSSLQTGSLGGPTVTPRQSKSWVPKPMAPELAKFLGAESAESGHPPNGERPFPDELAEIVTNLVAPVGKEPPKWSQKELASAVRDHMRPRHCVLATNGGLGLRLSSRAPTGHHSCGERAASLILATATDYCSCSRFELVTSRKKKPYDWCCLQCFRTDRKSDRVWVRQLLPQ